MFTVQNELEDIRISFVFQCFSFADFYVAIVDITKMRLSVWKYESKITSEWRPLVSAIKALPKM